MVASVRVLTCWIHTEWLDMRCAAKRSTCTKPCSMRGPSVEDVHVSPLQQETEKLRSKALFLKSYCSGQVFFYESCTCSGENADASPVVKVHTDKFVIWGLPASTVRYTFAPLSRRTVMAVSCFLWFVTVLTCWVRGRESPGTAHLVDWRHRVCSSELVIVSDSQGAQFVWKPRSRAGKVVFVFTAVMTGRNALPHFWITVASYQFLALRACVTLQNAPLMSLSARHLSKNRRKQVQSSPIMTSFLHGLAVSYWWIPGLKPCNEMARVGCVV